MKKNILFFGLGIVIGALVTYLITIEGSENQIALTKKEVAIEQIKKDSISTKLDEQIIENQNLKKSMDSLLDIKSLLESDKAAFKKKPTFRPENFPNSSVTTFPASSIFQEYKSTLSALDANKELSASASAVEIGVIKPISISRSQIKAINKILNKCTRVFSKPGQSRVKIDGADLFIKDQKLVGLGKIDIGKDAFDALTEAYALMDLMQYSNCNNMRLLYLMMVSGDSKAAPILRNMIEDNQKIMGEIVKLSLTVKMAAQSKEEAKKLGDAAHSAISEVKKTIDKQVMVPNTQ